MPSAIPPPPPSLTTYLRSLEDTPLDKSITTLISLLKRRQIRSSRSCALATTKLLIAVVEAGSPDSSHNTWSSTSALITRIRQVGRKLISAQPKEIVIGNIVRRVLGVIREVADRDSETGNAADLSGSEISGPTSPVTGERSVLPMRLSEFSSRDVLSGRPGTADSIASSTFSAPMAGPPTQQQRPNLMNAPTGTSLFSILQHPQQNPSRSTSSPYATPPAGTQSPALRPSPTSKSTISNAEAGGESLDIKAEVLDGLAELLDELSVVDSQIAESALEHIHSGEVILTHGSSRTVQRFLLTAAGKKRKFTVFVAESYPNDHSATHDTLVNGAQPPVSPDDEGLGGEKGRWRGLTAAGVTVVLVPDMAVFALMPRVNKVLLSPHAVMANGSLLAAAGTEGICLAAKEHRVPVVVLAGVYKLSPVYPFDEEGMVEYGDPSKVVGFAEDGRFVDGVDIVNPLSDFVGAEGVGLYVTNLGGCAPSYLYRVVGDHYRGEDVDLGVEEAGSRV
ncbi:GCD complex subunit gcd7 [Elasticomyces elasticus]|nr:GCD complex subunit gcd7 [Elasticomyces elasticus]KAK3659244.1 GCD complex subunit gcd7 [Elasticomyces elasticus]KAK4914770.1 GCD complex subunit gcd7 [Elasticomyces elasticus]KAK5754240.1 GCD complex subunit gcd7 [Elasticomyces elasticus]